MKTLKVLATAMCCLVVTSCASLRTSHDLSTAGVSGPVKSIIDTYTTGKYGNRLMIMNFDEDGNMVSEVNVHDGGRLTESIYLYKVTDDIFDGGIDITKANDDSVIRGMITRTNTPLTSTTIAVTKDVRITWLREFDKDDQPIKTTQTTIYVINGVYVVASELETTFSTVGNTVQRVERTRTHKPDGSFHDSINTIAFDRAKPDDYGNWTTSTEVNPVIRTIEYY